jgi:hypothetical protein
MAATRIFRKREKVNPWSLYEPRNTSKTSRLRGVDYMTKESSQSSQDPLEVIYNAIVQSDVTALVD